MKSRRYLLLLAAVVLICVGLAQTRQGHTALSAAGLYEKPATYAELAFSTPDALPSTLPKPGSSVRVSFGIHNVSDSPGSFQWSIAVVRSGVSKVKASGTDRAPAQGQTAVTRSVVAACTGGRAQVVVRLVNPAESISFWLTCPAAAKPKAAQ